MTALKLVEEDKMARAYIMNSVEENLRVVLEM
jgi:hypothetical protein